MNNNFQNNGFVPREPDFPPREPQVFKPDEKANVNFRVNENNFDIVEENVNKAVNQPVTIPTYDSREIQEQEPKDMGDRYYKSVYENANNNGFPTPPQPPVFEKETQAPAFKKESQPPVLEKETQPPQYQQIATPSRRYPPQPRPYQNGYGYRNYDPRYPHTVREEFNQNPYNQQTDYRNPSDNVAHNEHHKKPKKNTGLKVFLICLSVVFGICVLGFVALVSYSLGQSSTGGNVKPPEISYTNPFSNESPTEPTTVNHSESDYSDKINPSYAGLTLNEQVQDKTSGKYTSEYAYNAVSSSVVGVICYAGEVTDVSQCTTQGTGIVISEDGYIITNAHIINNSKTEYAVQVVTSDNKTFDAGVVAYDVRSDIALLKADATGFKPAIFGKSKDMQIGSTVIAVGNPGGIGYQNSLTMGIISAFDRTVPSATSVKYIQTDAAINPGNSGGPLCNLYGQIIGMNTSKIVSEQYEGMGFAIPSETIKGIVDQLMTQGYVSGRVKMGVVGIAVDSTEMQFYNVPAGIWVVTVDENGPLKDSEIEADDIITKVAGENVSNFGEVFTVLEKYKAGDKITLEVYRYETEETFEVELILVEDK